MVPMYAEADEVSMDGMLEIWMDDDVEEEKKIGGEKGFIFLDERCL